MKIIQVVPYFHPHTGGSEWYCHQLSKHLADRGHEVHVLTSRLDKKLPAFEKKDGFFIHRCYNAGIIWNTNPVTYILHKLFEIDADIIHAHSYIFLTSNQVALRKKLNNIPFILHLHGGIDCNAPSSDASTRIKFWVKNNVYDPTVGKWTVRSATKVVSVSKVDMGLAKNLWGLENNKLEWLPNAVDLNSFNGNNHNDDLNVLFIGRLEPWKGVHMFLDAAGMILDERDDVTFTVVGDGSLRNHLENNGYRDRIKVLGRVPHNKIPEIISNASILTLPSYMEGLPTVCLEASASEVPVVASNVGGTSEIVIEKETGFLVPSGDTNLFVNRIMTLLDNKSLRTRMGKNGKKLIEKHYTWDKVVTKTEKIYETLIEQNK